MNKRKMVIVARTDLNMTAGKLSAQVGHAVAGICLYLGDNDRDWTNDGMKKVTLAIDSEKGLLDLRDKAEKAGLKFYLVQDAGKTSIPEGTYTCLSIGPASEQELKKITGSLKLYP